MLKPEAAALGCQHDPLVALGVVASFILSNTARTSETQRQAILSYFLLSNRVRVLDPRARGYLGHRLDTDHPPGQDSCKIAARPETNQVSLEATPLALSEAVQQDYRVRREGIN